MLEMFGFKKVVLIMINVIEINNVFILNGKVKMMCLSIMKILLKNIVCFVFNIWLDIYLLMILDM